MHTSSISSSLSFQSVPKRGKVCINCTYYKATQQRFINVSSAQYTFFGPFILHKWSKTARNNHVGFSNLHTKTLLLAHFRSDRRLRSLHSGMIVAQSTTPFPQTYCNGHIAIIFRRKRYVPRQKSPFPLQRLPDHTLYVSVSKYEEKVIHFCL